MVAVAGMALALMAVPEAAAEMREVVLEVKATMAALLMAAALAVVVVVKEQLVARQTQQAAMAQPRQHLAELIREAAAAATVALEVLLAEAEAVDKVRKVAEQVKQQEQ